jgi:hypothetical protein
MSDGKQIALQICNDVQWKTNSVTDTYATMSDGKQIALQICNDVQWDPAFNELITL